MSTSTRKNRRYTLTSPTIFIVGKIRTCLTYMHTAYLFYSWELKHLLEAFRPTYLR